MSDVCLFVAISPQTRRNLDCAFSDVAASGTAIGEEQPRAQDIEEMKEDSPIADPCLSNLYTHDKWMNLTYGEDDDGTNSDNDEVYDGRDAFLVLEDDAPPQPELLFDYSLLALEGGHAQLASGQVDKNLLKLMAKTGWNPLVKQTPYHYHMEPYDQRPTTAMQDDYPGLYTGPYGPTTLALNAASTPARAFFFFAQPTLGEDIAAASNDYFLEKMDERVEEHYNKQLARTKKKPRIKPKSQDQIRGELSKIKAITAGELCVFVGLLVARVIAPHKEKIENFWKVTDVGAIPRGCFGQFMVRDRFMHLSRNLHFSSNASERVKLDRAWKLRPVIDALTERFQRGYIPPPTMAFDEAMLPSQSSFNRMRVFMKDKPHRWGTKLFMLCCSTTAYCIR
ncbi:unnamed protein product [Phytophthora fragariaefolia]|uniref:Unnamed protein product n=1 Tax=Phytophthora fragariaefolia TaxID=1490495 RepID=A0A9W6U0E8_9STRA|nr:unnamed protein product [Phytophthora fragariaefolia]